MGLGQGAFLLVLPLLRLAGLVPMVHKQVSACLPTSEPIRLWGSVVESSGTAPGSVGKRRVIQWRCLQCTEQREGGTSVHNGLFLLDWLTED